MSNNNNNQSLKDKMKAKGAGNSPATTVVNEYKKREEEIRNEEEGFVSDDFSVIQPMDPRELVESFKEKKVKKKPENERLMLYVSPELNAVLNKITKSKGKGAKSKFVEAMLWLSLEEQGFIPGKSPKEPETPENE